jgi:hypothetical protein
MWYTFWDFHESEYLYCVPLSVKIKHKAECIVLDLKINNNIYLVQRDF